MGDAIKLQRRKATSHAKFVFKRKCAYLDAKLRYFSFSFVEFIVVFRDDFSTIFQSCVVIIVHEGVMVHNPKNGFEIGVRMPKIQMKNVRERARGEGGQEATCGPSRGPHGQRDSLPPCGPRASHGAGLRWPYLIGQKLPSLSSI
ncbi:hypothetical protein Q3G72_002327 [Acer saccharum]|nr:hypothetical protein Q3G72_002327 [Acer saccharum]